MLRVAGRSTSSSDGSVARPVSRCRGAPLCGSRGARPLECRTAARPHRARGAGRGRGGVTEVDKIAHLADAVQARLTTADRLLAALAVGVATRVDGSSGSALRHCAGHLLGTGARLPTKIERQHGLPGPRRQSPTTVGRHGYRDVEYDEWGLLVELDGLPSSLRAPATTTSSAISTPRSEKIGARSGSGGVRSTSARAARAGKVATMLGRLGWPGAFTRRPRCQPER